MSAFFAEVIGTTFIVLFGCGIAAGTSLNKSNSQGGGLISIAFAWAVGVTLGLFAAGKISGAHLNPAVTIGFAMAGNFPWSKVPSYLLAQFVGAMLGSTLVFLIYYPHWKETLNAKIKLAIFSTIPGIHHPLSNFLCEFIATFVFLFGIVMLGAGHYAEGLTPLLVGALILGLGLVFGGPTGCAINPARDLGPRIMHALLPIEGKGPSDWSYSWIPVVAPLFGGICGTLLATKIFPIR